MSADWYFMKKGFFGTHKTVGPISEIDLCAKIEKGEINPETMLSSTTKTHGHWLKMKDIRVAKKHWDKTHHGAA
jgi:hypothetical protein